MAYWCASPRIHCVSSSQNYSNRWWIGLDFMAALDDFPRVGLGLRFHEPGSGVPVARPAHVKLKPHRTVPLKNQCCAWCAGWTFTDKKRLRRQVAGWGFCRRRWLLSISISRGTGRSNAAQNHQNQSDFNVCIVDATKASARQSTGRRAAILRLPVHRRRRSAYVSSWDRETPAV